MAYIGTKVHCNFESSSNKLRVSVESVDVSPVISKIYRIGGLEA